jgi:hypothetical protein
MAGPSNDKTSVKFWEGKVYKFTRKGGNGKEVTSPYFYANPCHGNKMARVCLQTANKLEAAGRAKNAYLLLKSQGWEAMWEVYRVRKNREEADKQDMRHRGEEITDQHKKRKGEIETIGEFVEKVKQVCFVRPKTLHDYIRSLYHIISDIYGIDYGSDKYNYHCGKNLKRIEEIRKIKIDEITPEKIEVYVTCKTNFYDNFPA